MAYLSTELYSEIHAHMPIPCIDAIIIHGGKVLLFKRTNKPAKGQWWFPGGRIHKGEAMIDAVQRKMHEEIGQEVTILKQLGTDETIFPDGPFGGPTHTINTVFLTTPTEPKKLLIADEQHSDMAWFQDIPPECDPYIHKYITLALSNSNT